MSKYSGRRVARGPERPTARASAPSAPSSARRGLFLLAGGITVTLIAWGLLVFVAIEFGRQARTGSGTAWGLLGLATVGAAACLYLTLLLAMKTVEVMQRKPSGALPAAVPPTVPAQRVVTAATTASSSSSSPHSSSSRSAASRHVRPQAPHARRAPRTPGKRIKR